MDSNKPICFFKLFITDERTNKMVLETNKYVVKNSINTTHPKGVLV